MQYWTSKGFTVAEVNYGGSSGFGREYRERLNYQWGILDSYDCKALVLDLIRLNLVDSTKVAILGNSAGGLTAINALCEGDLFKVAICKYPVLDLNDMHHKTHRFEKGYLNSLIGEYARPESFWFKGFNNQPTHSFIYKPLFERFVKSPLIVKAHSGPTACFYGSLNSEVQYWTSKGFTVAEVNYGGSSGFGREYRERLNYKWGNLDSYDCKALVLDLIRLSQVDSTKVAILGNSAGGLTAINALCAVSYTHLTLPTKA